MYLPDVWGMTLDIVYEEKQTNKKKQVEEVRHLTFGGKNSGTHEAAVDAG